MKFKVMCTSLSGVVHTGCTLCQVFFWVDCNNSFILEKNLKRLAENPEFAEMRHDDVIYHYNDVKDRRAASV